MRRERLEDAIKKGINFLNSKQHSDGKWTDFELEVGHSTAWTTAYVVATLHRMPEAQPNVRRACDWLLRNFRQGWGFNETVPIDCDSTAWGIIALAGAGIDLPAKADGLLSSYRDEHGLFRTFSGRMLGDQWGEAHIDVTVVAARALLKTTPSLHSTHITQTINSIIEAGEHEDWHAYWWSDPMYVISHGLETLNEFLLCSATSDSRTLADSELKAFNKLVTGIHRIRSTYRTEIQNHLRFDDPFKGALLANSWIYAGGEDKVLAEIVSILLDMQEPRGKWRGAPKLRVTYPTVSRPWEHVAPGLLFADIQDVFTTATVVNALETAKARLLNI